MHVLQVTPYYPPTWAYGGIPRIVDGLSRALAARGHRVTVLTTDAGGSDGRLRVAREREDRGVHVITVPNLANGLAYQHQLFLPLGARRRLQAAHDAEPVDVVHLHGHRHLLWAQLAGALAQRQRNTLPGTPRLRQHGGRAGPWQ